MECRQRPGLAIILAILATNRRFPKMLLFSRYLYQKPIFGFLRRFPYDVTPCQEHYKYTVVGFDGKRLWSANAFEESLGAVTWCLQCELESW
ncbi:hypothetical protein AVEN_136967-1 [Araneus ventricosus]|uniref:Uncharacterized protein n=1 Tax=Araneus ventricosus TaxID=182803 RepID=A0A4Y2BHH6_ARAVE|nr:hypothetical protein AVEN_136967-1 [Araneus ventricosus]